MAQRTEALTAHTMSIMSAYGINFLAGPTDFDECLYEISGRIADACSDQTGYMALFKAALGGVAAGMAIGKHIERQRFNRTADKEAEKA